MHIRELASGEGMRITFRATGVELRMEKRSFAFDQQVAVCLVVCRWHGAWNMRGQTRSTPGAYRQEGGGQEPAEPRPSELRH